MQLDNMTLLKDTLNILSEGSYEKDGKTIKLKLSDEAMRKVHVLIPDEGQDICAKGVIDKKTSGENCRVDCVNMDSFADAIRMAKEPSDAPEEGEKPVLVMNLANPANPGGGVRRGAKAQEEDLCRRSSLLVSLESRHASKFYDYHRALNTFMGSTAMIFTPEVEIIRDENGELLDETQIVSVVTIGAPMVRYGYEGLSEEEYRRMIFKRMNVMLKCAAYFGYEKLVLGAWGCGALGNDAKVISDLFCKALKEIEYNGLDVNGLFKRIDFAVLDDTEEKYNYNEFFRNFGEGNFHK